MSPAKIKAVFFDLDDTLYDQRQYLFPAFMKVSRYLEGRLGIDAKYTYNILVEIVRMFGSASGKIFDMLLQKIGCYPDKTLIKKMVAVFYSYRPRRLIPYPRVIETLSELKRRGYRLGIITDGYPEIQRTKLKTLNLEGFFEMVVISDEYGRRFRKPHVISYLIALEKMHVKPNESIYVGDNPLKDFYGANKLGMTTIRIRSGEYANINVENLDPDYRPKYEIGRIEDIFAILKSLGG